MVFSSLPQPSIFFDFFFFWFSPLLFQNQPCLHSLLHTSQLFVPTGLEGFKLIHAKRTGTEKKAWLVPHHLLLPSSALYHPGASLTLFTRLLSPLVGSIVYFDKNLGGQLTRRTSMSLETLHWERKVTAMCFFFVSLRGVGCIYCKLNVPTYMHSSGVDFQPRLLRNTRPGL